MAQSMKMITDKMRPPELFHLSSCPPGLPRICCRLLMEARFPHPGCCRKSQEEFPSLLFCRLIPLLRMRRLQLITKRWNSVLLLPIQKIPEHFQLGEQTRVKTISNNPAFTENHHSVLTRQKLDHFQRDPEHQTSTWLGNRFSTF